MILFLQCASAGHNFDERTCCGTPVNTNPFLTLKSHSDRRCEHFLSRQPCDSITLLLLSVSGDTRYHFRFSMRTLVSRPALRQLSNVISLRFVIRVIRGYFGWKAVPGGVNPHNKNTHKGQTTNLQCTTYKIKTTGRRCHEFNPTTLRYSSQSSACICFAECCTRAVCCGGAHHPNRARFRYSYTYLCERRHPTEPRQNSQGDLPFVEPAYKCHQERGCIRTERCASLRPTTPAAAVHMISAHDFVRRFGVDNFVLRF